MLFQAAVIVSLFAAADKPATRVAVLVDDPAVGAPVSAALESALQARGFEVVDAETSARMRKVVAPRDLLKNRLPEGLSVFEADAILAGAVAYAEPAKIDEGVANQSIVVTVRLLDLGTGKATTTTQETGFAVGAIGPTRISGAAKHAVRKLFRQPTLLEGLQRVGQSAGSVTLVVQGLPHREALVELRQGLEKALAGAPAREVYFARGLGKLLLGGSKSPTAMRGPDIADIIAQNQRLALSVVEVANTRIVARYDRSRTVRIHALVLEPKLDRRNRRQATQLGKYVATQLATFDFARASYQRGQLGRKRALRRARRIGADVLVESEVLKMDGSSALVLRVIDVSTGRPITRKQQVLGRDAGGFEAAQALLTELQQSLPEKLANPSEPAVTPRLDTSPTAAADSKKNEGRAAR